MGLFHDCIPIYYIYLCFITLEKIDIINMFQYSTYSCKKDKTESLCFTQFSISVSYLSSPSPGLGHEDLSVLIVVTERGKIKVRM